MSSLLEVASRSRPYPAQLLAGCETGLALFAAAFLGWNDSIHFARHGIRTTCVDRDATRLSEMRRVYPDDWRFVVGDAYEFALEHSGVDRWDAVTVDPFFGDAAERVWEMLDTFISLATRLVTVTVPAVWDNPAPDGWTQSLFRRSERASWLVLTPC